MWKRRMKRKVRAYYLQFGVPELMNLTKIIKLEKKKYKEMLITGQACWYGGFDLQQNRYEFEEITIRIYRNLEDEAENIIILHEVAHVIHRLELRLPQYPFDDHTPHFFEIAERIDPFFRTHNKQLKYFRR